MSLEDFKPAGFTDEMRHYAHMTRPGRMYVQGFGLRDIGVWLDVDGVHTLIGYGTTDEALAEAEAWTADQLDKVRKDIAARLLSGISRAAGL